MKDRIEQAVERKLRADKIRLGIIDVVVSILGIASLIIIAFLGEFSLIFIPLIPVYLFSLFIGITLLKSK